MKIIRKQTMMIVWKWKTLDAVNEKSWEDPAFVKKNYLNEIDKGKGVFYEEYPVEWSEQCPDARLIAANIYQIKEGDDNNEALLDALLEKYLPPIKSEALNEEQQDIMEQHEFVLLLHRGNEYTQEDLNRLLDKFKDRITKIFLFANNRDFIYYHVRRKGLLDDFGKFFKGTDLHTGESIVICGQNDKGEQIIKQPYFDRAWLHYKIEFETKVFHLKEDLFTLWLPFLLPNQPEEIQVQNLLKAIKKPLESTLYYRLKSFLDHYSEGFTEQFTFEEKDTMEDEINLIIRYERKDKKSYLFDDCIINLEHQKKENNTFVSDEYEEIKTEMNDLFFNKEKTIVTKEALRAIMNKLNYLVKIIPGLMD